MSTDLVVFVFVILALLAIVLVAGLPAIHARVASMRDRPRAEPKPAETEYERSKTMIEAMSRLDGGKDEDRREYIRLMVSVAHDDVRPVTLCVSFALGLVVLTVT